MTGEMTAEDLARSVAKDLEPQLGAGVTKSTEAALNGDSSRGWGEAMAVGHLLVAVSAFAWDVYKDTKSRPELKARLLSMITKPAGVSDANVNAVVEGVVDRVTAQKA